MDTEALSRLYQDHVRSVEKRYATALDETGFDAVIVHSGTPKKRTEFDDQFFPLRPTPEFHLWAPLTEPDCFVVFETGKKTMLVWPECRSFWERPAPPDATHFTTMLDVRRVDEPDVASIGGGTKRIAWIGEDAARAAKLGLAGDAVNPPKLVAALDRGRVLKTPYEIACLAEANRIAALGHEAVRKAFEGGARSELELHLAFLGATKQDDQETPYKNIVALGRNGAVLHHVSYGRDATRAESLLLDAGACYLGYCSDITRTWARPVTGTGGSAGSTFSALVLAMEAMQKRLVAKVAIGMPYEELHDESHRQMSAILKESGLATGTVEEIDKKGVSRAFYPHGLGHSLGLVTHDVGCASLRPRADNPFLRNTSRIAEDQVFTIEPGLYFIDGLLAELRSKPEGKLVDWNMVEAVAPFGGIRIEDDVLVLREGVRNFTREVLPIGGATV
ncbi:MAG: Xaa-Pro dipeptidase PepQ [Labilithrix sp.]|nr:Xaa-Pro dipeptidase PepQ [Labilithrix sp.]